MESAFLASKLSLILLNSLSKVFCWEPNRNFTGCIFGCLLFRLNLGRSSFCLLNCSPVLGVTGLTTNTVFTTSMEYRVDNYKYLTRTIFFSSTPSLTWSRSWGWSGGGTSPRCSACPGWGLVPLACSPPAWDWAWSPACPASRTERRRWSRVSWWTAHSRVTLSLQSRR